MIYVLRLISELQTAAAHPEVHGIHVDHSRIGFTFSCLQVCFYVNIQWNLDINFLLAPLTNRLGKAQKPWVGAGNHLEQHGTLCSLINQAWTAFKSVIKCRL